MEQQVTQQPVATPTPVPMTAEPDLASILSPQAQTPEPVPAVADPALAPTPAPQPAPTPTVPLPELLEQRHARQLAEQKAQFAEQRLAEYQRALEAQYQASQPPPPPLDPIGDPEGFARAVLQQNAALQRQMQEQAVHQRANTSEMLARGKYGDQVVDAAVQAAIEAGHNRTFMMKPDPYKALMDWHNAQTVAQQVGPDLKSWEARKEAEIEARILAKHGIKAQPQVNGATPQTLPPSLSTATRANAGIPADPMVGDASDFFKAMMAPRKRQ